MNGRKLAFSVSREVLDLGVKIQTLRISGVTNSTESSDFEELKKKELENVRSFWGGRNYKDDPILTGFRDLHTKVGRSNRDYVASPEDLTWLFLERGRFPHINMIVDIYNLVSLKTRLAFGAHDVAHIQGNISLRLTDGSEVFEPLGKIEKVSVFPGEYGYVDDGNNVICRMEVLQVEPTKVTEQTTDIFVIVQGNMNTESDYVKKGAELVSDWVTRFCGGTAALLN